MVNGSNGMLVLSLPTMDSQILSILIYNLHSELVNEHVSLQFFESGDVENMSRNILINLHF